MSNRVSFLLLVLFLSQMSVGQEREPEIIHLESAPAAPGMVWNERERTQRSQEGWPVVSNVSSPSLQVIRPEPEIANGTGIIIAPGGGFHMLSMANEGIHMAKWCAERGITAFVLKYRLVPTGADPVGEFRAKVRNGAAQMDREIAPYIELAKEDGLAAIAYVRSHAGDYNLQADRIGIIGFSAGGTLAGAAALEYTSASNRPDFAAPIYGALQVLDLNQPPEEPMPLFLAVTSDDIFGFQKQSVDLYRTWNGAGLPGELHIYEKGGHGFGMRKQNLPSDAWIDAFATWLIYHDLLSP